MGINRNGANGSLSGKVGSVVYVSTKSGITIVRGLPKLNKNRKPTEGQRVSRNRFRIIQQANSKINYFIRKGFEQYDIKQRACDSAMSYNLLHAVQEEADGYTINWERFTIAKGLPNPMTSFTIDINEQNRSLNLTWEYDNMLEKKYNLRSYGCHFVLLETDGALIENTLVNEINYPMSHKKQDVSLPVTAQPHAYHMYVFFFADDGSNKSTDSIYLGIVEA